MGKHVSGRQAAVDYLTENGGGPLPVKQVTEEAARRAKLKGKTPSATIAAQIYTTAKNGRFFKIVERGMVELVPVSEAADGDTDETDDSDDEAPATDEEDASADALTRREVRPHPKPTRKRGRHPVAA